MLICYLLADYQYCPGHARKLKKARKEQRKRQQQNAAYKPGKAGVKQSKLRAAQAESTLAREAVGYQKHPVSSAIKVTH